MSSTDSHPPPPDPVVVLCDHTRFGVYSLEFGQHGTALDGSLFSGHEEGLIIEWELSRNRPKQSWTAHGNTVLWISLGTVCGNTFLFSQGRDGAVKVWFKSCGLWSTKAEVSCSSMLFCNSTVLCVNKNQGLLAVPNNQPAKVDFYEFAASPGCPQELTVSQHSSLEPSSPKEYGNCMKMSLYGDAQAQAQLYVGYESGVVALWDVLQCCLLSSLRLFDDPIMCLTIWKSSHSGQDDVKGCCGSASEELKSFCVSKGVLTNDKTVSVTNAGFSDLACRKDSKIMASAGWDNAGRVFSTKTMRPLAVLTYHQQKIGAVTFSHNHTLAMGCRGGYITIWDVYQNKLSHPCTNHSC